MKKHLLFVAIAALSSVALSAQINYPITDSVSASVTSTTVNYNVLASATDTRHFTVTNATANTVTVKVKKTIYFLNDPGSTVYFCTGANCYSPSQTLSLAVVLAPNGTCALTCDHYPNNMAGVTQVRYTVINQANTTDTTYFIINYTASLTGVATHSLVKPSLSNPAPNPASSSFTMNYKMGSTNPQDSKMVIYNMLGDRVMETSVEESEGALRMDVSSLEQGVYFCSLESDGKIVATRRLVVTR